MGAMYFIRDMVDERLAATAQGLHATVTAGVIMSALVIISGPLYERVSVLGYFVMMASCVLSLLLLYGLYRAWGGKAFAV